MKRVRIFSIIFCIAAGITFFVYLYKSRQILDNTGPKIIMDSDTVEISVEDDTSAIFKGITAEDSRDGDCSQYLLVEQFSNFIEKGRRQATIAAFDSAGNVTKTGREVFYTDYESPKFSVSAPFYFPVNSSSITQNITAYDCLDGDLTVFIKLSSEEGIDLYEEGTYDAVFMVSNSAGDTARLPVTVDIYDSSDYSRQPHILLSDYLIYVEKDTGFYPENYIEEVYYGSQSYLKEEDGELHYQGDLSNSSLPYTLSFNQIEVENPVDTSVPGVYEVTYRYSWGSSDTGSTRLIVVVTE